MLLAIIGQADARYADIVIATASIAITISPQ